MHISLVLSQRLLNKPTFYRPVPIQKAKRLCRPAEDWGKLRDTRDEAASIPPPDTEAAAAAVELNQDGSVKKETTAAISDEAAATVDPVVE